MACMALYEQPLKRLSGPSGAPVVRAATAWQEAGQQVQRNRNSGQLGGVNTRLDCLYPANQKGSESLFPRDLVRGLSIRSPSCVGRKSFD